VCVCVCVCVTPLELSVCFKHDTEQHFEGKLAMFTKSALSILSMLT
jgi:hypothetical protein